MERDRLDGEIADLIAWTHSSDARGDVATAIALLRQHVHDELRRDMKLTKKPLFAEISNATAEVKNKGRGSTKGSEESSEERRWISIWTRACRGRNNASSAT